MGVEGGTHFCQILISQILKGRTHCALTERSPYLWHTVPTFWMETEDGAENPFQPEGWVADSEDAMVCPNFSVEGLFTQE